MYKIFPLFFIIFILITCDREWNNIVAIDDDLKNPPVISQIDFDSERNISIIIDYSYSDSCQIQLERKDIGGFELIPFVKATQTTLTDTSFDREKTSALIYRVRVIKGKYHTTYSNEMQFEYTSLGINKPTNLIAVSIELQGIRLQWKDESNYEDGYIIEKDAGSGYSEFATVSPNVESFFDQISGTPENPLHFAYRIKTYNSETQSDWVSVTAVYSGLGSPTNLKIISKSAANFVIEWQDNSIIETGYSIERMKDGSAFEIVGEVDANITRYTDIISEIGIYAYRVKTMKDNYYSSYSNEVFYEITSLPPSNGLVSYWPFSENADDASGNGNDGSVYGSLLSKDRFGSSNSAYSFDGKNDYIDFGNDISLRGGTAGLTIVGYFNANQASLGSNNQGTIIEKRNPSESKGDWGVYIRNNSISWRLYSTTNDNGASLTSTQILNSNQWYFFAVNYIDTSGKRVIYINDVLVAEDTRPVGLTSGSLSNNPVTIAKNQQGDFEYFNGLIDDIRIYNRSLLGVEILQLYHEGGWDE